MRRIELIMDPQDDIVAYAYLRMKRDGTLGMVFHEGEPNLAWIADFFDKQRHLTAAVAYSESGESELIALGWLNQMHTLSAGDDKVTKAEAAMVGFRGVPLRETREAARILIQAAFETAGVDVLYATVSSENRAVGLMLRALGFRLCGRFPRYTLWRGKISDSCVWCLSREEVCNGRSQSRSSETAS
jgi:hypothetical protein